MTELEAFYLREHCSFSLETLSKRWVLHFLSKKPNLLKLSPHVLSHGAAISFVLHSMRSQPHIERAYFLPDLPH